MNEVVLVLGLLALVATGGWLAQLKPWRRIRTPEPKLRVRSVREYVPPPSIPRNISIDAVTGRPKVVLRQRRQISIRDYPQVYRPRSTVQRHLDPLYKEKGWRRDGRRYQGYYRVNGRRWRGEIRERHRGFYEAFIYNPPMRHLEYHPHGPCFQPSRADGRFKVHFQEMPMNVDQVIVNVETILSEALARF